MAAFFAYYRDWLLWHFPTITGLSANDRYGPLLIVGTRAVPILAEAAVLAAGMHQLAWTRFLWPLMLSNLGIAAAYSALGDVAATQKWLPFALALATAAPLLVTKLISRLIRGNESQKGCDGGEID